MLASQTQHAKLRVPETLVLVLVSVSSKRTDVLDISERGPKRAQAASLLDSLAVVVAFGDRRQSLEYARKSFRRSVGLLKVTWRAELGKTSRWLRGLEYEEAYSPP